jgi:hypothetical protein
LQRMEAKRQAAAITIQRRVRSYLQRVHYCNLRHAVVTIQSAGEFIHDRHVDVSVDCVVVRAREARKQLRLMKLESVAVTIQRVARFVNSLVSELW